MATELDRKTFAVPLGVAMGVLLVLGLPRLVLDVVLLWKYPDLRSWDFLLLAGARVWFVLPGALLSFVRIPVVVDSAGFRLGWFWRVNWEDVTGATVRTRLGFRTLNVFRQRRFTFSAWLRVYDGLPTFLASHAPEGNPLRLVSEPEGAESRPRAIGPRGRQALAGVIVLVSYGALLCMSATLTRTVLFRERLQVARQDPLYRLGTRLNGSSDSDQELPPFEEDIALAARRVRAPAPEIFRLMGQLQGVESAGEAQYAGAASTCKALGWSHCDQTSLQQMRKVLRR